MLNTVSHDIEAFVELYVHFSYFRVYDTCFTFNPPEPAPAGVQGEIALSLNVTMATAIYLFVHNRDQAVIPSSRSTYGTAIRKVSFEKPGRYL